MYKWLSDRFIHISDGLLVSGAMIASILLALNNDYSKWAYVFFIISSLGGMYVGYYHKIKSIFIIQAFYVLIDVIGVWRWFF